MLVAVRRAKTEAKGSMRTQVDRCVVTGPPSLVELVELASADLADAGAIARVVFVPDPAVDRACRSRSTSPHPRPEWPAGGAVVVQRLRTEPQCRLGNMRANTSGRGIRSRTTVATSAEFALLDHDDREPARLAARSPAELDAGGRKWPVNATRQVATRAASTSASGTPVRCFTTISARGGR